LSALSIRRLRRTLSSLKRGAPIKVANVAAHTERLTDCFPTRLWRWCTIQEFSNTQEIYMRQTFIADFDPSSFERSNVSSLGHL
jgi:hypothetical protein